MYKRQLLTSDLRSSLKQLLQIYFDRWQIEVNHREEKDTLGVGQAQLRNLISVSYTHLVGSRMIMKEASWYRPWSSQRVLNAVPWPDSCQRESDDEP